MLPQHSCSEVLPMATANQTPASVTMKVYAPGPFGRTSGGRSCIEHLSADSGYIWKRET